MSSLALLCFDSEGVKGTHLSSLLKIFRLLGGMRLGIENSLPHLLFRVSGELLRRRSNCGQLPALHLDVKHRDKIAEMATKIQCADPKRVLFFAEEIKRLN